MIGIILETSLDREKLDSLGVRVRDGTATNRLGTVPFVRLERDGVSARVYEHNGMTDGQSLPQSVAPVFADMYLQNVSRVYILGYCGSLNSDIPVGQVVVPADFGDFTKNRTRSLIDLVDPGQLFFYRMAQPFSAVATAALSAAVRREALPLRLVDAYAVTEGPRFETAAEIRGLQRLGYEAVCFSGVPEAVFARELNMDLACGFMVSNLAEGLSDGMHGILDTAQVQRQSITGIAVELLKEKSDRSNYHDQFWMQRPPRMEQLRKQFEGETHD